MKGKFDPLKIIKILFLIIFFTIIVNLFVLDYYLIKFGNNSKNDVGRKETALDISQGNNRNDLINQVEDSKVTGDECPKSCIQKINESTSLKKLSSSELSDTSSNSKDLSSNSTKEFFIPLGSGAGASRDWSDVSGAQAYIDSSMYGEIKTVVFEPSVFTPTGNQTVWVRLYNVTDKHPVWYSEVSMDGGLTKLLFSQGINLDQGNKLYQVQIKTGLGYISNLEQARIHITTY